MVEAITKQEFYMAAEGTRNIKAPEASELDRLNVGDAFRSKCRWSHRNNCNGARGVRLAARKRGIKIHSVCRNGTLYVLRTA